MRATLLLLAGGQSRRMGRPKALLPVAGKTLIEWILDRLAPGFDEVLIAAGWEEGMGATGDHASDPVPELPYTVVYDFGLRLGPLAGIQTGLEHARHGTVFALACDMPFVTLELARTIVRAARWHDAAVPRIGGRPEPVCAAYRRSARDRITAALRQDRLQAADVLNDLDVRWLDGLDPTAFRNINTPDDYQKFLDALPNR